MRIMRGGLVIELTPDEEAAFEAMRAGTFHERRHALKERANAQRHAAIYTDITLPFPVELKVVQFRNDVDRQNLSDKVTGALASIVAGHPEELIPYVCGDNSIATMTAEQFVFAGKAVLTAKDAVFYAYKVVKDMIDAAEDDAALVDAETALQALIS